MSSNMLLLPFRRTHTIKLSDAIRQYISTKYDQHPDMFKNDLDAIDELRKSAAHAVEPHVSGVKRIQAYAAQLIWLTGKFPIDIGVDFTWYPAIGYQTSRPNSENNLRFELANVVFNLASMYSQLAVSSNRNTEQGLKIACNYFSMAAGVLSYLKSTVIPEMRSTPPDDMDIMTLESLERLMLAQAQESVWQKAIKTGLKDSSIAKLAAKVSDYYNESGEAGIKSDSISSEWIHHMTAKHHHFAAAAQYRASRFCLEKRQFGEEVARLNDSLICVSEGLKEARYINKVVLGDLTGLKNIVQEDLKRAEKDNDMIYLQIVPPKSELKSLERANMVSSKVPEELANATSKLGEKTELGAPLFSKLVPYSVHLAASIYADRRDRLINHGIIEELEALNAKIHDMLTSLNLPGSLQALEKPLGLPPGLVAHAEEIRDQDGINRIRRSIEETKKVRDNDTASYQEGVDLLRAEQGEDDRARRKYGTERWARPASVDAMPKLFAQIDEIGGYLKQADNSDGLVRKKLKEHEYHITLLGATDRDLEQFVPSSRRVTLNPAVEKETSKLRGCLNEVNRLENKRKRKVEHLRIKAKQDDISAELLKEAARLERDYPMQNIEAVQFEDLFEKRLELYDDDQAMVKQEEKEQRELVRRLQEANSAFTTARKGDTSSKHREEALQMLENAFFKYKEIINNVEVGRRFYNDLAKITTRFRDDSRNFAYQRRAEASQLESDLSTGMASLSLDNAHVLKEQKKAEARSESYAANQPPVEAPAEPLTAPTPTRANAGPVAGMWTPEMGIKFGDGQSAGSKPLKDARWNASNGLKFG
ncbi:BRO1-domain-containing protein [Pseudovirgaria hyperparasitica]|uniref:BRO1-domain-containing protein n=1 Tax=Pseudovirgaria hyperparasitica TaxID=470096 RepID=A0A6A6W9S5_9PEZI|nr:BRO1-domain-containing protein [Pseudovirgaria hyperparasitica]KAF2759602.1 BRO1-domain-containing protein [Pseudovirgaria hyperparasitica]